MKVTKLTCLSYSTFSNNVAPFYSFRTTATCHTAARAATAVEEEYRRSKITGQGSLLIFLMRLFIKSFLCFQLWNLILVHQIIAPHRQVL